MSDEDPLFSSVFESDDWWLQLAFAEAWAAVARLFEPSDPGVAGIAWGFAAHGYDVYCEQYDAHLPASRFDYDYGREAAESAEKARLLRDRCLANAFPEWVMFALQRRFGAALEALPGRPEEARERALLSVLAIACRHAKRNEDAERLEAWAKDAAAS